MTATPYQFVKRGNLFIVPVGPAIAEVPYPVQTFTKPPDYSLWVHGEIREPGLHLDRARMSTRLYQEVRDDLTRYSPVEVTRSAIQRSSHAYIGVIDSRGTPYYFALDSRGVSVREAETSEAAWKAFDRIAEAEHMAAVRQRRHEAASEMREVDQELSIPRPVLVVTKGLRYGRKVEWRGDVPGSTWWRNIPMKKPKRPKRPKQPKASTHAGEAEATEKAVAVRRQEGGEPKGRRDRPGSLQGAGAAARRAYAKERAAHEAPGGVAVGHTRVRPSHGDEAKPVTKVPHYADRPEHVVVGPGHEIAGEPEHVKPRGTTSIWRPGDDERRVAAADRERRSAPPRFKTHEEDVEHDRQRVARHRASDDRARARHMAMTPPAKPSASQESAPKKRGFLSRLFGKGVPLVALPCCQVVRRVSSADAAARVGTMYASEVRRAGAELARRLGEEDLDPPRPDDVGKALPKSSKESKTKKTPSRKASKKQLGAGGKTRYTYPQEKKGGGSASKQNNQVPLVVVHNDTKNANPAELANQLNVSVRTLQRTARRLGDDGFASFMRSRLKRFAAKHRLDPDYWNTLYAALVAAPDDEAAKD